MTSPSGPHTAPSHTTLSLSLTPLHTLPAWAPVTFLPLSPPGDNVSFSLVYAHVYTALHTHTRMHELSLSHAVYISLKLSHFTPHTLTTPLGADTHTPVISLVGGQAALSVSLSFSATTSLSSSLWTFSAGGSVSLTVAHESLHSNITHLDLFSRHSRTLPATHA